MYRALFILLMLCGGCAFEDGVELEIDPDSQARCVQHEETLTCERATMTLATGRLGISARQVHLMHPTGQPPADGWPAVLLFQGSFHSAAQMFEATRGDDFGGFYQTQLVASLLEAGFAVIAPEAQLDGATFWETNVLPYSVAWKTSADHAMMMDLFEALEAGTAGPINSRALFAAGISSGGYMTSRMAVSYPGRFKALAIQSGSYATCSNLLCVIPALGSDHPPTLFLHGEADLVVPLSTARDYMKALHEANRPARLITEDGGHQWSSHAPAEIVAHFLAELNTP